MGSESEFETGLQALFTRVFGQGHSLETFNRLSGGASQETWALAGSGKTAILRRAPGGGGEARSSAAIGLPAEAKLIQTAATTGVPVPDVFHVLDDKDGIGDGFLMSHLLGETIARPILRNPEFETARSILARQCGAALSAIHSIPTQGLPSELQTSDGMAQIAQYETTYRAFDAPRSTCSDLPCLGIQLSVTRAVRFPQIIQSLLARVLSQLTPCAPRSRGRSRTSDGGCSDELCSDSQRSCVHVSSSWQTRNRTHRAAGCDACPREIAHLTEHVSQCAVRVAAASVPPALSLTHPPTPGSSSRSPAPCGFPR